MLYLNILAFISLVLPIVTLICSIDFYYNSVNNIERISMLAEDKAAAVLDLAIHEKRLIRREEIYGRHKGGVSDLESLGIIQYRIHIRRIRVPIFIESLRIAIEKIYKAFWMLVNIGYGSPAVGEVRLKLSLALSIILFVCDILDTINNLDIDSAARSAYIKEKINEFVNTTLGVDFLIKENFIDDMNRFDIEAFIYNFVSVIASIFMFIYNRLTNRDAIEANISETEVALVLLTNAAAYLAMGAGQIEDILNTTIKLNKKRPVAK
ncbi:hypothetical protein DB313_05505 (plasmid) [Borrelia turcica IST7]|uniref:Uncharacterized protein n=1 Tax=Borrelia turcica IST7 TaxID=1104446 RepID=A0A386PN68_9SPIR|nr:hypothetical protein [Borrelia turcica]AYE36954.1 hypothetical protein DB313_05505 [Borrelia turcica IST7]